MELADNRCRPVLDGSLEPPSASAPPNRQRLPGLLRPPVPHPQPPDPERRRGQERPARSGVLADQ